MRVILDPWKDRAEVERIWRALGDVSRPTYFLTWAWVENWLATLPPTTALKLVALVDDEGPRMAWFIGARIILHGGVIPSRARFLNATGIDEFDDLTIEHNGWLARTPETCTIDDVLGALEPGWDEIVLGRMDSDRVASVPQPATRCATTRVACHTVSLDKVRAATDYLALLTADTRAQIRRSQRRYAERGALEVEVAADLPRAKEIFDELVLLHAATWSSRGQTGAFSPYLRQFHTRLIEQRFAHGEIQLVRIRYGESTIGCLYNFVHDGIVSFYQSGFAYEADNKLKPGLVCHAEAIGHNAQAGHTTYDFLGGDTRYKRALSTDSSELASWTIEQECIRFAVEDRARGLLNRWRSWRAPS